MDGERWGRKLALYLLIAFGVAWGVLAMAVFLPEWSTATFGPMSARNPLFYLAVWSPNIAALITVAIFAGRAGLADLFARLVRWRVSPWVWIAALGFYPLLMFIVQLIQNPAGATGSWWAAMAAGLVSLPTLALGPLGEELGWRGVLLPLMLRRLNALAAGLVVGAIWMFWHLPAFFVSGLPQDDMVLPLFMVGGTALSVYVTWLFVNARQSILIGGIIPHAIVNAYGDATGAMSWVQVAVMIVGAILLVAVLGPSLRGRTAPG
jgi:membrane protease YdiL (CAAX protease family)